MYKHTKGIYLCTLKPSANENRHVMFKLIYTEDVDFLNFFFLILSQTSDSLTFCLLEVHFV